MVVRSLTGDSSLAALEISKAEAAKWKQPKNWIRIRTIETHTWREPLRLEMSGLSPDMALIRDAASAARVQRTLLLQAAGDS